MSALRVPGPDGRVILVVIDDGAVGRVTFSRRGLRGGSEYTYGALVTGESTRARDARIRREWSARHPKVGTP